MLACQLLDLSGVERPDRPAGSRPAAPMPSRRPSTIATRGVTPSLAAACLRLRMSGTSARCTRACDMFNRVSGPRGGWGLWRGTRVRGGLGFLEARDYVLDVQARADRPGGGRMSDLYEEDILAWSERETAIMRDVAEGRRPNQALDWPNIIEEVESLGREQVNAVMSHLVQAMIHDLKASLWPSARDAEHWRDEADQHRDDARARITPAMRQRIDVQRLYERALARLRRTEEGRTATAPFDPLCPRSLDQLLGAPIDAPCGS